MLKSIYNRLRRAAIIPLLRTMRVRVSDFETQYVYILAVGCSDGEEKALAGISDAGFAVVARELSAQFGGAREARRVRALCFGSAATEANIPGRFYSWLCASGYSNCRTQ